MTVTPYSSHIVALIVFSLVNHCNAEDCPRDSNANRIEDAKASLTDASDSVFAESSKMPSSLSLLQRTATMMSKVRLNSSFTNSIGVVSKDDRRSLEQRTASSQSVAWPMAVYSPEPSPFKLRTGKTLVITAPLAYRITLAILSIVLIALIVIFLYTEESFKEELSMEKVQLEKAVAISGRRFCERKEEVLQDFLRDSDGIYLVPVDGRKSLTYKALNKFLKSKDADVSRFGVAGNDRLAVILGSGPEAAVAFWAFSAQCQFCPINPQGTNEEIDFTLQDLPAKAVVVYKEDLERIRDFPIIECIRDKRIGGLFTLKGTEHPIPVQIRKREDIALVIQTSGTTKKPKIVPLTHENLILSCSTIVEMIKLETNDRSLSFLPLFHIGGIANNVISPLISQSSVICAGHFTGEEAFNWVQEYVPSWYYGSPTTHMLMMRDHHSPRRHRLRLIRNATAALLPSIAEEMSSFWSLGAPTRVCEVLPGYGMSECSPIASHQAGKYVQPASVGPFAGPEVKIREGEILIRGPMVFQGYEVRDHMSGEDPNKWIDGWFPTGDCGQISNEYLYVIGRSKELIIRGGENISPFEVEDAIGDSRVAEKVAFSVSHEELGEVVALAVKTSVPDEELPGLLKSLKKRTNLDPRKFPEIIVSVQELPKGVTGKYKRIGLQRLFSLGSRSLYRRDPVAYTFADNILIAIDIDDDTVDLGGPVADSLGIARKDRSEVAAEVKAVIMGMYACTAFAVVAYRAYEPLVFPRDASQLGTTIVYMMGGNVVGGMRWTTQCFMACAAYLQCKENFSLTRMIILIILYFAYKFPIGPAIKLCASGISSLPYDAWRVGTSKRWFIGVMIFSYASFAYFRHKPYPGLQCFFLAALTLILNIWPVSYFDLYDVMPSWFNFIFEDVFVCGLFCWVGCIMVYFVVGHYGHVVVSRVLAHPLAHDAKFQRGLVNSAPIILLLVLFAVMWGPQQGIARFNDVLGNWKWDPLTVVLDQIVSVLIILLLSQAVRKFASRVAPIGACALGIYLGGDIVYFCPYGQPNQFETSFGIIIDRYEILPTLQRSMTWTGTFWPAMVVVFAFYCLFQLFVFGIPFHKMYLQFIFFVDWCSKKMQ